MIILNKSQKVFNQELRAKSVYLAIDQIDWKESDHIISICCGKAHHERYIVKNYQISDMICFDINKKDLSWANKKKKEEGLNNISFVRKDICSLNLDKYKHVNKLLCFGYSHDPLNLLFVLFRKKDLFDFLQRGGKFYIYPAEGGAFFREPNRNDKDIYFFERTLTETTSNYMSFLSNVFETQVYNNSIIEIGKCLIDKELLDNFLLNIRSDKSVISFKTLKGI